MEQAQAQVATPAAPEVSEVVTEEAPVEAQAEETTEAAEEAAAEPAKEALKFKRKINGKMIEATEDELWKHYGLEVTAQERLKEAAKLKKEIEGDKDSLAQFFADLRAEPKRIFELAEKLGHDPKKLARQMVLDEIEYERMSPEQKRILELEAKVKTSEQKEADAKKKEEEHQEAIVREEFTKKIDDTISEALKLTGLSMTPKTVAKLAEACQALLNASDTGELPTADKVVKKFLAHAQQDAGEFVKGQNIQKLIDLGYLDKQSIAEIAKYHLDQNKANLPSFGASGKAATKPKETKKQKVGVNEWFKNLGT